MTRIWTGGMDGIRFSGISGIWIGGIGGMDGMDGIGVIRIGRMSGTGGGGRGDTGRAGMGGITSTESPRQANTYHGKEKKDFDLQFRIQLWLGGVSFFF